MTTPDDCPLFNRETATGRFIRHNLYAYEGAQARAAKLSPARRHEIAVKAGRARFARLVEKLGEAEARRHMWQLGAAGADIGYANNPAFVTTAMPEEPTR